MHSYLFLPILISHSFFSAVSSFLLLSYALAWFLHVTQSLFGGLPALMRLIHGLQFLGDVLALAWVLYRLQPLWGCACSAMEHLLLLWLCCFHHLPLSGIFSRFLNIFSQRCHKVLRLAHLWPVVGPLLSWLELSVTGLWPRPSPTDTNPAAPHPVPPKKHPLSFTPNTLFKIYMGCITQYPRPNKYMLSPWEFFSSSSVLC